MLWLTALFATGCGLKGPPVAPRQDPPPAVMDLSGQLQENHLILTWSLAADALPKKGELDGFNLYRARSELSEAACRDCPKVFEQSARIAFAGADTSGPGKLRFRHEVFLESGFHHVLKLRAVLADGRLGPDSNLVEIDH
jgi:hypothetical protein